jgi:LysM repeat protein
MALAAFAVAFLLVLMSSGVGGGGDERDSSAASQTETSERTTTQRTTTERERRTPATYTVRVGDTLAGIAERTGLTVEQLLELNPDIDPQALVSGQELKLRE